MDTFLNFVVLYILCEGISVVWGVFKAGSAVVIALASNSARQPASPQKKQVEATAEVQSGSERAARSAATIESQMRPAVRKGHRCERCGRTWPWDGSRQGDDRCFACGWIPPAFRR